LVFNPRFQPWGKNPGKVQTPWFLTRGCNPGDLSL